MSGNIDENTASASAENMPETLQPSTDRLDDLLGYARAHAATSDTRVWVDDLEQMLSVAWNLMSPEQKRQFRDHPDIIALKEAAGESTLPS